MKVIIAGSRRINDYARVCKAVIDSGFEVTEVVSGRAKGVDTLGEQYAEEHNLPAKLFPADWGQYGRAAGPIRNGQMAEYADALIAIWNGESRGTENMVKQAVKKQLKIFIDHIAEEKGQLNIFKD